MDEMEISIQTYKLQLDQVKLALQSAEDVVTKEELTQLSSDLEELISVTEENLLEMKRKELLAQFPDSDDDEEKEEESSNAPSNDETVQSKGEDLEPVESREEDEELDLSVLEGVKCRAPHFTSHSGGQAAYHDAIIFAVESVSDSSDVINVRVVFSHPTQPSMLPCPFFMDGKCRFTEETCKYSHGEVVTLASLREYKEPVFASLAEGSSVLAKDSSDGLWHHATVEGVEGDEMVHLRFSHNNKSIYTVPIEMVLPLTGEDDKSDGDDEDLDNFDEEDTQDFVPEQLLDRISGGPSGPLGDWEQFTRGMGSKLMASMGYVMGAGLGKRSEGRIEPVPAMLYPVGRSLDWCMNLREKAGGNGDALTVEKTLKRQQAREEKREAKRIEREKGKTSVFDFINNKLGGKRGNVKELITEESFLRKDKKLPTSKNDDTSGTSSGAGKSTNNLNVESFKVGEEIRRIQKDLVKLRDSYSRLKDRDPKSAKAVEIRLKEKQETLKALHGREKSLHTKQSIHNEKKKLAIF